MADVLLSSFCRPTWHRPAPMSDWRLFSTTSSIQISAQRLI